MGWFMFFVLNGVLIEFLGLGVASLLLWSAHAWKESEFYIHHQVWFWRGVEM